MRQFLTVMAATAGALAAGCASYSERVIEKPVPAATTQRTTVYTEPTPGRPATSTVYTTPAR